MTTGPLTEAQLHTVATDMLEAYNRHDVGVILEHLTDDVVWTEPTLPEPARGKDAVKASLQDTFTAFPDLQVHGDGWQVYLDVAGQSMVVTWSLTGTMTGPLDIGVPATGRSIRMSGANVTRFRDGLVCEHTSYYDSLEMMQQMGLLPRSTGMAFKAIVLADVLADAVADRARKVLQRH